MTEDGAVQLVACLVGGIVPRRCAEMIIYGQMVENRCVYNITHTYIYMFEKNWKQLGDSEAGEDFFGVSLSITLGFKIQPARSRTRHWGRHAQDVLGIQQEHQLVDVNGEPLLRRGTCLDAWLVSAVKGGLGCENLVESIQKKNIC